MDEPSKGLKIQGRTVKKPNFSEEFWSTSTYEMENSGVQSQKSISSISTLVNTLDHHGGIGSTSNHPEFVNHGECKADLLLKCLGGRIAPIILEAMKYFSDNLYFKIFCNLLMYRMHGEFPTPGR